MNSQELVKVIDANDLDHIQYCFLQKKAFEKVLFKNKISSDYLTPDFFKWKYSSPAGQAKLAIVERNGKILASVAYMPVFIMHKNEILKIWQCGDIAMMPNSGLKGITSKCMIALNAYLAENSFLYGFPNDKSWPIVKRIGFQLIQHVDFFGKFAVNTFNNVPISEFTSYYNDQDDYAKRLNALNFTMIYRSKEYMNWRYVKKPVCKYYCFNSRENNLVMGNVVLRIVEIKRIKLLLIMEFTYLSKKAECDLLKYIKNVASLNKCRIIGIFSTNLFKPEFLRTGFIQIPSYFMPKEQIFVCKPSYGNDHPLLHVKWFVQTGDWDAF